MVVDVEHEGSTLIASVEGRVDGSNARKFHTTLEESISRDDDRVVLDLEKLRYLSSAGLRVILMTAKMLQGRKAKFAVCGLSASIKEVFEISGFDKIISVYDSRSEAVIAVGN